MINDKLMIAFPQDYCVLDLETTGLSAYKNDIIEIGILKVRNDVIIDRFQTLVDPGYPISGFITRLTGISNQMVADAPSLQEVEEACCHFIGNDMIVGYNINFDMRFINANFSEPIKNPAFDLLPYARKLYPELEKHSLTVMVDYLHLRNNEHRAIADTIATYDLLQVMKEKVQEM